MVRFAEKKLTSSPAYSPTASRFPRLKEKFEPCHRKRKRRQAPARAAGFLTSAQATNLELLDLSPNLYMLEKNTSAVQLFGFALSSGSLGLPRPPPGLPRPPQAWASLGLPQGSPGPPIKLIKFGSFFRPWGPSGKIQFSESVEKM